ncbi:MAG: hypothetical protein AUH85_13930 [Chloroflexi bacterium 13_1_40CM_4_68_4]|nr:MAG: hypothetical protein AUH85_13930 [Chloroflexi bacterium 13_1_40CM_4_68_4]
MTRKTAISLPDDLYREIERARKRSKKDRSTWLQEAASEYLKKRTKEEEIEAWLSADERFPPTKDELAFYRWQEAHWSELLSDEEPAPLPPTKRRRR